MPKQSKLVSFIRSFYKYTPLPGVGVILLALLRRLARGKEFVCQIEQTDYYAILSPSSFIESGVIITGFWEKDESMAMHRFLKRGDNVIDIGANVGLHSIRMSNIISKSGLCFSIEPNTEVHQRLIQNCSLNNIDNIITIQSAVSCKRGHVNLYVNSAENSNRNATLLRDPASSNTNILNVNTAPLDILWATDMGRAKISFIKVDIEGYELDALKSGSRLIKECRPIILAEFSNYYYQMQGMSWNSIQTFFNVQNYNLLDLRMNRITDSIDALLSKHEGSISYLAIPQERSAAPQ